MKKHAFYFAFALGALAVVWVAFAVASTHLLVLAMTAAIAAVYLAGTRELHQYRRTTAQLAQALTQVSTEPPHLETWLSLVPVPLQHAVRQRIEGERIALPEPVFTPYLVGLLVMLGMLGTFLGMVVTLNGAVFALEGSSSVQGMRAAFSEPIKGLGLAFGTSVAGVATSAMLGLMANLSRRERAQAVLALDKAIATDLRRFSLAHQRQQTFLALQQQSQALPQVVEQLQLLMAHLTQHSQQLGQHLLANQAQFHSEVKVVYGELAQSVNQSLQSSLRESMQLASDGIRPVVQATLATMAEQAQTQHERMVGSTQTQLSALHQQFSASAQSVAQTWTAALAQQQQAHADLLANVHRTLEQVGQAFDTGTHQMLHTVQHATAQQQAQHTQRAAELATLLRDALCALREQEAQRGQAAVAELANLQTVVAQHLRTLGAALEVPIARLLDTAAEAPKAAAEVMGQLRQEISRSMARDNALLEERSRILETLNSLLESIDHASSEQRGVIDALVASSQDALEQTRAQFHTQVQQDSGKLGDLAAQLTASAIDVASLGQAFATATRGLSATHEKLIASLQRIEEAIGQSMTRSDDQLAYYVAQARELIDLSIGSQKDVLDALQHKSAKEVT